MSIHLSRWLTVALCALLPWVAGFSAEAAQNDSQAAQAESEVRPDRIDLYVGEVRALPIKPVSRVAMGNPRVVSSTLLPSNQLLLMADAPGDTTVHIWLKNGRELQLSVRVSEVNSERTLADVRSLLTSIPGVTARQLGGQVFIEGEVDPKMKPLLASITKSFPKVVDLTLVSDMIMKKMVHLDVRIMEFKKSSLERIGVDWVTPQVDKAIAGPKLGLRIGRFLTMPGPNHFANLGTDITSIIDLMVTNGDAVELAAPRLSTRSGGEATFLAGGQIPIPATNTTGQSNVTFKDYGIRLYFKPVTGANGNVLIKVETEVSTVDNAVTVQGVPGFLTRRTSAEINVLDGEPMALSGLIDAQISNNGNKLPGFGDLPILGALFRSNEFRNERTELIVFVEPHIIDSEKYEDAQADDIARKVERTRDQLLEGRDQGPQ